MRDVWLKWICGKFFNEVRDYEYSHQDLYIGREIFMTWRDKHYRQFFPLPYDDVRANYILNIINRAVEEKVNTYMTVNYMKSRTPNATSGVPAFIEKILIDIDSKEQDLDKAKELVKKIIERLLSYNVEPYIQFSGKKGYHIFLWLSKPEDNVKLYRYLCKAVVYEYWSNSLIDTSVFEPHRVTRVPYTIHADTGYQVQPLDVNLKPTDPDFETLWSKAVVPEELYNLARTWYEQDLVLERLRLREYLSKFSRESGSLANSKTFPKIVQILYEYGVPEGGRNNAGFIICCYLKARGYTYEEALQILLEWNLRNKPPLPEKEIVSIVKSVYKHDYKPPRKETILEKLEKVRDVLNI